MRQQPDFLSLCPISFSLAEIVLYASGVLSAPRRASANWGAVAPLGRAPQWSVGCRRDDVAVVGDIAKSCNMQMPSRGKILVDARSYIPVEDFPHWLGLAQGPVR